MEPMESMIVIGFSLGVWAALAAFAACAMWAVGLACAGAYLRFFNREETPPGLACPRGERRRSRGRRASDFQRAVPAVRETVQRRP